MGCQKQHCPQLTETPTGISENLMTFCLLTAAKQPATLFSAYSPALSSVGEMKDIFTEILDETIREVHENLKIFLLEDCNTTVVARHQEKETQNNTLLISSVKISHTSLPSLTIRKPALKIHNL